jgi:hypothetical protein
LAALVIAVVLGVTGSAGLAHAEPGTPETSAMVAVPPLTPTVPETPVVEPPVSTPPEAPPDAQGPLEVTASFGKAAYRTGELVDVEISVKNVSQTRLTGVAAYNNETDGSHLRLLDDRQWGDFFGGELAIEPGASHTVRMSGYPFGSQTDVVVFSGAVLYLPLDQSQEFSVSAPVTKAFGDASGTVYADKNGNGRADAGEGMPDVTLKLEYAVNPDEVYQAKSGADGAFKFAGIPTVKYLTAIQEVDGWKLLTTSVEVTEAGVQGIQLRGVRTLTGVLTPEVKFTKDSYQPGELAHITATLTNNGDVPLTGIVARCHWYSDENSWGWDDGVTLPANRTMTFDIAQAVPADSLRAGVVIVYCYFDYLGYQDDNGPPVADDTALVPGGRATLTALVVNDPEGELTDPPKPGVPGVKVVLVDGRSCKLGEKVTDAQGNAVFGDLPAAQNGYSLYFFPPAGWKMHAENPRTRVSVFAGEVNTEVIAALPGEGEVPVLPAPAPACGQEPPPPTTPQPTQTHAVTQPPAGQPTVVAAQGKVVRLANTGVDVLGLGTTGMVFLLLGTGVIVATRRRGSPGMHRD